MPAPAGNQFALKYKTPEERQELCRKYCEHIERGYSDESFPECDIDTLKQYMKDYPEDFGADVGRAKRLRLLFWEKIGISGTVGQISHFNAKSWEFNMSNRFGWRIRNDLALTDSKQELPVVYLPHEEN